MPSRALSLSASAPADDRTILSRRRLVFSLLVAGGIAAALLAMARLLGGDGLGAMDLVLLLLFAAMLPWNLIGFWNAVIGLLILWRSRDPVAATLPGAEAIDPSLPIRARTAILMPIYNERPERVFRHLASTVASLDAQAPGAGVEVFLLSDTQDPAVAAAEEERRFAAWRAGSTHPLRLHYRRRISNDGHKAGNLWSFLDAHGHRFDLMVILDADSVMSGTAILRLIRLMQAQPQLGIVQHLSVGLPSRSPFARLFQFGMRHGMRTYTVGSAWWQGCSGPYWGHNAIVRIAPFMAHCRLPRLPGRPPLGGRILSHDQVEAVLLRRAGYEVRVLAEESGSYEENPPTLLDHIKRDLRWCQGNWQYVHLLRWPGLPLFSRVQLLLAILMYVAGPAWVLFSLTGFGMVTVTALAGAGAAAAPPSLLGTPAPWEGWALLGAVTAVAFAPKLAGMAQVLLQPASRKHYGGGPAVLLSAACELVFSLVLTPAVAVAQAVFIAGMLGGRAVRWEAQRRDGHDLSWGEALAGLWPQTVLGLLVGGVVLLRGPSAPAVWAALFSCSLSLVVPFARLTARQDLGQWMMRRGIGAIPEEIAPPAVLRATGHAPPAPPRRRASAAPDGVSAGSIGAPAAPQVD